MKIKTCNKIIKRYGIKLFILLSQENDSDNFNKNIWKSNLNPMMISP